MPRTPPKHLLPHRSKHFYESSIPWDAPQQGQTPTVGFPKAEEDFGAIKLGVKSIGRNTDTTKMGFKSKNPGPTRSGPLAYRVSRDQIHHALAEFLKEFYRQGNVTGL